MTHALFLTLVCAAAVAIASPCLGQIDAAPSAPAVLQAESGDALYRALGGQAGIDRLMDDFVPRLVADARISDKFSKTDLDELKKQLASQVCMLSGGGCKYRGAKMKAAHADMDINKANFNALVEDLQLAMDAQDIGFTTQNQLLALLAPMHRDIITVR